MPIPPIAGYPMPTRAQLGEQTLRWRPDPRRAVLLVHDMQRYFVDRFPAGTAPTVDLVANTVRARQLARRHGLPVLYTAQPGRMSRADRGLLHDLWGPGMSDDPAEHAIIADLTPGPGEPVVTKHRYSAFHRTDLAEHLTRLGRDQIIVCGVFAHIGCLLTACDAYSRDIEVFLVADAVADFSLRDHLMALDYAARRCAVTLTTHELAAYVGAGRIISGQR
ncbi:isochorismatase family protein [Dactylosporangium cerinum]|uniref:Isochorismatase family protein n=1 Tax=Dactylosporangium cerinum TaxID=1434730 RepID=A0ABV9WI14_9ACTN